MMANPGPGYGVRPYPPVQQPEKFERALDFLEQVKLQFQNQPHVYNQFLEIMKDFKTKAYVLFCWRW
jgi:histone deacetylase complex regulatory component SIN3